MKNRVYPVMSEERWIKWLDVANKFYGDIYRDDDDLEHLVAIACAYMMEEDYDDEKEIKKAIDRASEVFLQWGFFYVDSEVTYENIGRGLMRYKDESWDYISEDFDKYIDYEKIGRDLMDNKYSDTSGWVYGADMVKYHEEGEQKAIVMFQWTYRF